MADKKHERDQHYKCFAFRLDERTVKKLKQYKKATELTWNLLFHEMMLHYKLSKRNNMKYQPYAGKITVRDKNNQETTIQLTDNN